MNGFILYILFALVNALILVAFDVNVDRHFKDKQYYALPLGVYMFFTITSFFTTIPLVVSIIVTYFTYFITK